MSVQYSSVEIFCGSSGAIALSVLSLRRIKGAVTRLNCSAVSSSCSKLKLHVYYGPGRALPGEKETVHAVLTTYGTLKIGRAHV